METNKFPGQFSNRFYVSDCGVIVRLSFGERLNEQEALHTGIVLIREDALSLRDLLNKMFSPEPSAVM